MTIGILGGGQLGRMLALAGYPLGLRFRCFDASAEATAGQVAELAVGSFKDEAALAEFADGLDLITFEFENVPLAAAEFLARRKPFWPPPAALAAAQERLAEKTFFQECGLPTPRFLPCETRAELEAAARTLGLPAVLKTRRFGYDGKGQALLRSPADLDAAFAQLGGVPLILEAFVNFDRELSLIAVRSGSGETAFYPLVENLHQDGMLRRTLAPAPHLAPEVQRLAERHAAALMAKLGYVGVLAIEFFQVGGQLLANEMAPRVHNSGHWTIEGAQTSQFENHLRAVLGWPLGATAVRGAVGMLNLIGAAPEPGAVLAVPGAHLHLYGKEPRPGRKIGHITLLSQDDDDRQNGLERLGALFP